MKKTQWCIAMAAALTLAACGGEPETPAQAPGQDAIAHGQEHGHSEGEKHHAVGHEQHDHDMPGGVMAHVTLEPTEGNEVRGQLQFMPHDDGVHVNGAVTGLEPNSTRGFHIHEHGDCSAPDAMSAGGHFNPDGSDHGRRSHGEFHAGDMDNLQADAEGNVEVDMHLAGLEIGTGGPNDIVGKSVIVHVQADDYESQPTGDAGARAACGVIGMHDH